MRVLRWLLRLLGALLIVVGSAPFTGLIWVLVFVRGDVPAPLNVRLHFWQTEVVGGCVCALGATLILASLRHSGSPR